MSPDELERQQQEWDARAQAAQAAAAQAFGRLLGIAQAQDTGQARRIALFLASTYRSQAFPFDLFDLRAVDMEISHDMLCCLDALRWGKADLHKLVPDGERRTVAVIESWGIEWPQGA